MLADCTCYRMRVDARRWPVRGTFADCTYIIVSLLKANTCFITTSFQEGPYQILFFYLQESEEKEG